MNGAASRHAFGSAPAGVMQPLAMVLPDAEAAWHPAPDAFDLALAHGMAPLVIHALRPNVAWKADLVARLDALELYAGERQRPLLAAPRGLMPLVAAALQLAWVRLAQALCPCCGSAPVASVVHIEPQRSGVRYLHCSLCATEWHLERVKCSVCGRGGKLLYLDLEDERGKPFLPA
ncbi:hypothetical protein GCM10027398_40120 [Azotobacter salinestris]